MGFAAWSDRGDTRAEIRPDLRQRQRRGCCRGVPRVDCGWRGLIRQRVIHRQTMRPARRGSKALARSRQPRPVATTETSPAGFARIMVGGHGTEESRGAGPARDRRVPVGLPGDLAQVLSGPASPGPVASRQPPVRPCAHRSTGRRALRHGQAGASCWTTPRCAERLGELYRLGFSSIDPPDRPVSARTLVVPTPLLTAKFDGHLIETAGRLLETSLAGGTRGAAATPRRRSTPRPAANCSAPSRPATRPGSALWNGCWKPWAFRSPAAWRRAATCCRRRTGC